MVRTLQERERTTPAVDRPSLPLTAPMPTVRHSVQAPRREPRAKLSLSLPPRYGMIVLGRGPLMLASAASVPLGPASTTVPRELLTFISAALGILLLLRASLAAPLPEPWRRWFVRWRWLVLAAALILILGTLVTFAGGATMILSSRGPQAYFPDIVALTPETPHLLLHHKTPSPTTTA